MDENVNAEGLENLPTGGEVDAKDDEILVDISKVSTKASPVGPGYYKAELVKVEMRDSRNNNRMINWDYVITEGEKAGRHLYATTTLTPDAMWKWKQTVIALGASEADINKIGPISRRVAFEVAQQVIGQACILFNQSQTRDERQPDGSIEKIVSDSVKQVLSASWVPRS